MNIPTPTPDPRPTSAASDRESQLLASGHTHAGDGSGDAHYLDALGQLTAEERGALLTAIDLYVEMSRTDMYAIDKVRTLRLVRAKLKAKPDLRPAHRSADANTDPRCVCGHLASEHDSADGGDTRCLVIDDRDALLYPFEEGYDELHGRYCACPRFVDVDSLEGRSWMTSTLTGRPLR